MTSIVMAIFIIILFSAYLLIFLGLIKAALYIAIFGLLLVIIFSLSWLIEAYKVIIVGNAPYVRSTKKIIDFVIKEIDFKDQAIVYELGCGDGRFLRALAKKKPVKAIGYEYFIFPYLLAQILNLFSRRKIQVYLADFFKADLSQADYIFCYLLPKEMERLEKKLELELKPGALVISNAFKFKNWQPEKKIIVEPDKNRVNNNYLYLYRK